MIFHLISNQNWSSLAKIRYRLRTTHNDSVVVILRLQTVMQIFKVVVLPGNRELDVVREFSGLDRVVNDVSILHGLRHCDGVDWLELQARRLVHWSRRSRWRRWRHDELSHIIRCQSDLTANNTRHSLSAITIYKHSCLLLLENVIFRPCKHLYINPLTTTVAIWVQL